jgi:FKBP-type peptidyl-prolyl cis-trans isomerase SlyD
MNDGSGAPFQVGPETWVEVSYSVLDADGQLVEEGAENGFVFGRGQLLAGLERALEGGAAGDRRSVELDETRAFGRRDEAAVLEVDRSEFPPDAAPGDRFEVENEHGALLVFRVLDVGPEAVVVDLNHPLAGQRVRFELLIRSVRPATDSEIEAAEKALASAGASQQNLLAPERLLQGPKKR